MNKKLSCHCGGVEAQVKVPESGFKKVKINHKKELVNQVSEYSNDQYKIFLILLKFILINIAKINLQLNLKKQFSTDIINHLKKAASKINNNTTFSILDFLNKNENDLFIYNLDKRIFSLNIFSSLKLINE